jgi:hypothetical protein
MIQDRFSHNGHERPLQIALHGSERCHSQCNQRALNNDFDQAQTDEFVRELPASRAIAEALNRDDAGRGKDYMDGAVEAVWKRH